MSPANLSQTIDELGDAWLAAWSTSAPHDAFAALCAANVHYEDPLTEQPLRGWAAVTAHAQRLRAGLPDLRLAPEGRRPAAHDALAIPCRVQGTHTGSVAGVPPSGRSLSLPALFYCELEAGPEARVVRVRGFFDAFTAGAQLGLLPARGTAGERALMLLQGFGLR